MPTAYLYLFSDACPSDWLVDGQDNVWHTIVSLVFQTDPQLAPSIEEGEGHEEILAFDPLYVRFTRQVQSQLPSGQLRKWVTGPGYREHFCRAFTAALAEFRPIVSACSFQEKVLRASKALLLASYNRRIGDVEGRGIGFEEFTDEKGRPQMKHSFLNSCGYREILRPQHKMLVLLLMAWLVADQYAFFFRDIISSGRYGFEQLHLTIVSDTLSGDDDVHLTSEQNLRHLIDPEGDGATLALTRSKVSDLFSGDLLVDNLAGWLTAAMNDPGGIFASYARDAIPSGVWAGWHHLQPSGSKLEGRPAIERLTSTPL